MILILKNKEISLHNLIHLLRFIPHNGWIRFVYASIRMPVQNKNASENLLSCLEMWLLLYSIFYLEIKNI
jgi:hypothetical protein